MTQRRVPSWLIAATFLCFGLIVIDLWALIPLYLAAPGLTDFRIYYAGALAGVSHGWAHVYDPAIQADINARLQPPLLLAPQWMNDEPITTLWLAVPFLPLPLLPAFGLFDLISLVAWVTAAWLLIPWRGWARMAMTALCVGLYPTAFGLHLGQVTLIVAAGIGFASLAADRRSPFWVAGCLAVLAFKPHMAWVVPLAFLLAGHRKAFLYTAALGLALVVAALIALGWHGIAEFVSMVKIGEQIEWNYYLTPRYVLGKDPVVGLVADLVLAAIGLACLWARRRAGLPRLLGIALMTALISSPYLHGQDVILMLLAALLLIRTGGRRQRVAAIAFMLSTELFSTIGPLWLIPTELAMLAVLTLGSNASTDGDSSMA